MAVAKTFPLSLVLTAVDRVSATMTKVSRGIGKVGKNVTEVGTKMTTGLTLPIAGVAAAATKGFADFEKGMASVSTLIDTNTENLGEMGKEVQRIGRNTPVALEDLTAGLYSLRSAGIAADDQFVHLERSAQLATAGLGTTDQAVDLATSAINSFGLEGEAATKVYENIFQAVKFGKTNLAELSQGFGAVSATVAATGTEVDEYLSAVAAMTTTGLKAAGAHTQMKAAIAGLTRENETSRKVFRALGAKDLPDLVKQYGGLVPALQAVHKQVGGNQSTLLKLVGSTEAANAVTALSGELAGVQADALKAMRTETGALAEGFAKQNKTLTASWQRTKNTLLSAGMVIGESLAPLLEMAAQKVREFGDWWRTLDDSTKGWVLKAGAALAVLGPLVTIVGKAITVAGFLARAIGMVSTAVRVMTTVLIANPIGAVVAAIAAAAFLIWDNWETLGPAFELLWEDIKSAFGGAWDYIEPIIDAVVGGVRKVREAGNFLANLIVDDDIGTVSLAEGRRMAGLAPPAPPLNQSNTNIQLDITGAPRGARATVDPQSEADVGVSVGYQMGASQ